MTDDLIAITADIVSAHVSNNTVAVNDLPALIANVYGALAKAGASAEEESIKQEPAVAIRSSIKNDYIVCLEDGAKLKMLKRYLRTNYDMSPEDYRTKWGLPRDYPMVAPAYAQQRRELARTIGLGRKPGQKVAKKASAPKASAKSRSRSAKTEAAIESSASGE